MSDEQGESGGQIERRKEDAFRYIADDLLKDRKNQRRLAYVRTGLFTILVTTILSINFLGINPFAKGVTIPKGEKYVSMLRITGQINPGAPASAEMIEAQLGKAFSDKHSVGVLLVINSPGGTAVQGLMLKDLIDEYKREYSKKVIVYGEDILASGAYMASMAAERIYVTPSTITGSIGVIQQHFSANELMDKIGIEAKSIYSGEHKNRMSLYAPMLTDDENKIIDTTKKIHQHFIDLVKAGRGDKLSTDHALVFSGDSWVGSDALILGLVDGVAPMTEVIQKEFNTKYKVDYTQRSPVRGLSKIMSIASTMLTENVPEVSWTAYLPR
jgi:protease IV